MAKPEFLNQQSVVIGSGSNVIAMPVVEKLIIKMSIKGIQRLKKIRSLFGLELVPRKLGFVGPALLEENIFGLENLALIPGWLEPRRFKIFARMGRRCPIL